MRSDEKQGQIPAAIDSEERFKAAKRGELTMAATDEARGRLLRLREAQAHGSLPAVLAPDQIRADLHKERQDEQPQYADGDLRCIWAWRLARDSGSAVRCH